MVRLRPVFGEATAVADAVSTATGEPLLSCTELDVDVYRLHRPAGKVDLVARAFGPGVERFALDATTHVLQELAPTRFPAERCATSSPVLALGGGRHLLVTEYVEPSPAPSAGFVLAWCAGLLARLAQHPGTELPPGGGWHRLGATPAQEIDEALRLGGQVGPPVAELVDALVDADDASGLPDALIHADLTPPNAIPQGDQGPVVIDWVGCGSGPRIWPLAFLLFVAGPARARKGLDRYERSVPLSVEERHRLPAVMIARPLTLDLWSVAHERLTATQAVARYHAHRTRIATIAIALGVDEHG